MSDDLKILLFDKNDELPVSAVKCRMQQEFLSKLREDEFDLAIVVNDDSGNLKMMNFLRVIGHRAPLLPIIFLVDNNENDEKIDKLPDRLYHKKYYEYLHRGIEGWQVNKNFNKLELEKDNYLLSILKKAKIRAFGIEPVIGYIEGKEIEYKNIRIILEGKKTKIKENKIKELLRDTYV